MNVAIFLDGDGVLIEDVDLLTSPGKIRVLDGVPQALRILLPRSMKPHAAFLGEYRHLQRQTV
ncbi:MAG: hypothetical protein WCP98_17340 [Actinomycetes bacterium]